MNPDRLFNELMALAERYPEFNLLQFKTLVSARQYKKLYELVDRFIPAASRVLDWGCGNGHASYALNAMGHRVAGYSIDGPPALSSKIPTVDFFNGATFDPRILPYQDRQFDAVLSVGVLEHVREFGGDELASLYEIRRVLKTDGVFLCYHFPNRFSLMEAVSRIIPGVHSHAYRFTKKDIQSLCAKAGFQSLFIERYGSLPRNPWQSISPHVGNSTRVADLWDNLDAFGKYLAPALVQNYCFVAKAL